MDQSEVAALVAESRSRAQCWTKRLTGDAAVFMAAVDTDLAAGITFSPSRLITILNGLGWEPVGTTSLSHHLLKRCQCWKT